MGTSSPFDGANDKSPLLPSWLQGGGGPTPPAPAAPPGATPAPGTPPGPTPTPMPAAPLPGGVPPAPSPRPAPPAGPTNRFRGPRRNFSNFASSGGSDRRSLGRAISGYVSSTAGGSGTAAARMGSSRGTGARLVTFLNNAATAGARAALRALNLDSLAGRPIEEVFAGLADYICPEGGTIDEGIARDAFIETIADLAGAGVTDIDGLKPGQIQTVFELYAAHAIEARICNDIGTKVVMLPADPQAAERVQAQLQDFIRRGVADAVNASGVDIHSLSAAAVSGFVDEVYRSAFEILQTMGEAEASK